MLHSSCPSLFPVSPTTYCAGYYCATGTSRLSGANACSTPEVYCPEGSSSPLTTEAGFYAVAHDSWFVDSAQCRAGFYCTGGVQEACPVGRFGSSDGETSSTCTAICTQGSFCPPGSTAATQEACGGPAFYCPSVSVPTGGFTGGLGHSFPPSILRSAAPCRGHRAASPSPRGTFQRHLLAPKTGGGGNCRALQVATAAGAYRVPALQDAMEACLRCFLHPAVGSAPQGGIARVQLQVPNNSRVESGLQRPTVCTVPWVAWVQWLPSPGSTHRGEQAPRDCRQSPALAGPTVRMARLDRVQRAYLGAQAT